MNKLKLLTGILLIFALSLFAQKNKTPFFDIEDFNQKADVARWLNIYDAIAWWTSDSVMVQDSSETKRLGREWFCFQSEDKNWHAIYGKYENNKFDLVFHYLVDENYRVERIYDLVDTTILNGYSRALQTANAYVKPHTDSIDIRFNQYIKQNEDKTYSVWIFAAFQPNGWAVYGKEFVLEINAGGNNVIKDKSFYDSEFRGFEVKEEPREIWIDQSKYEKPTLGMVFFVWYYKRYFKSINIDNKYYITTAMKSGDSYSWMHIEKEKKNKKKNRSAQ